MKITKQGSLIIREENHMMIFERKVKRSLINVLINEALVSDYHTSRLREARLYEDAALEALEDTIVAHARKAGLYGKLGLKALAAFIKPIAGEAIAVAKDAGKWGIFNISPAVAGMVKFIGKTSGGFITGVTDIFGGIKGHRDLRKLAEKKPEEFKKIHAGYIDKFKEMGLPVSDSDGAAAIIGISETEDGKAAIEAAAQKARISFDDLVSQLNLFGQMAKHLDAARERDRRDQLATLANEPAPELELEEKRNMKITKQQLTRIIKEELASSAFRANERTESMNSESEQAAELADKIRAVLDSSFIPGVGKGPFSKSYGVSLKSTLRALQALRDALGKIGGVENNDAGTR